MVRSSLEKRVGREWWWWALGNQCSTLSGPSSRAALIKTKYLKAGMLRDEEVDLRSWQDFLDTPQELSIHHLLCHISQDCPQVSA